MYKWIETIGPAARKDRGTSHHEIYVTERQPDMTMTTIIQGSNWGTPKRWRKKNELMGARDSVHSN
jgi:hypothetical protein